MRSIRYYILKYRLAPIFKEAEQYCQAGLPAGSIEYQSLYAKAITLVAVFGAKYPDWNSTAIPALGDLEKLTIAPDVSAEQKKVALIVVLIAGSAIAIGTYASMISITYHAWAHITHMIGL